MYSHESVSITSLCVVNTLLRTNLQCFLTVFAQSLSPQYVCAVKTVSYTQFNSWYSDTALIYCQWANWWHISNCTCLSPIRLWRAIVQSVAPWMMTGCTNKLPVILSLCQFCSLCLTFSKKHIPLHNIGPLLWTWPYLTTPFKLGIWWSTKIRNSVYERKCDNRMRVTPSTCATHFASLQELFRKPNMQTQYGLSQEPGFGLIKKQNCFLFCRAWVVVLQNTNASKAFFYRGVITVRHWCLLFLTQWDWNSDVRFVGFSFFFMYFWQED